MAKSPLLVDTMPTKIDNKFEKPNAVENCPTGSGLVEINCQGQPGPPSTSNTTLQSTNRLKYPPIKEITCQTHLHSNELVD